MAEFCGTCRGKLGGNPDDNDLAGLCEPGQTAQTLCEGCGFIYVNDRGFKVAPVGFRDYESTDLEGAAKLAEELE